jgi:activating signal cointegrator complex subunit 3
MIFVHSRKEASKTAEAMRELASTHNVSHLLENSQHDQYGLWLKQVEKSRSVEVQQLFYKVSRK